MSDEIIPDLSTLDGVPVGLRERKSLLFCTRCYNPILVYEDERDYITAYAVWDGELWDLKGTYCAECEPDGGTIREQTDGVNEVTLSLRVYHDPVSGTIVDDAKVLDHESE